jgi:hypothetical protein
MAQSISQEAVVNTGLPGATAASRYAGATTSGAPTTGTFAVGDYVVDQSGAMWVCTSAGTPGTWKPVGAPGNFVSGQLGSTVNPVSTSLTTLFTIPSLSVGTWLINVSISSSPLVSPSTNVGFLTVNLATGTATSTFYGPKEVQIAMDSGGTGTFIPLSFSSIVTVTSAGTLLIQTTSEKTSQWQILAIGVYSGPASTCTTGYTAVRIA